MTIVNGKALSSIAQRLRKLDGAIPADQRRVVEIELFGKLRDLVRLIDRDADELQPLGPNSR